MEFFKAEVKKYEKKYKKRSKHGKIIEITRFQYSISLKKDNPFQTEDYVYILKNEEAEELINSLKLSKNTISTLNFDNQKMKNDLKSLMEENSKLKDFNINLEQEHFVKLTNQLDKLRNNYDHLQARFNKCQEEQNKLERELSYLRLLMMQIKKRSFWERIMNKLPEGLKELEEGKVL